MNFPDDYKRTLLQHSEEVLDVARVLAAKHDLPVATACHIVAMTHLDMTVALIFNSINLRPMPVKK